MKQSAIGWTDFSGGDLNFVTGCTPVSESCEHCYARAIYKRWGRDFDTVQWHDDKLERLDSKRFPEYSPKRGEGHRPMAFVCDTGDLFHEAITDNQIAQAFGEFASREDVIWQILTKRAQRMSSLCTDNDFIDLVRQCVYLIGRTTLTYWPPSNIWLGVTAENQQRADERIPLLLDTPAAVRFVSVEPMLGPITLTPADWSTGACLNWVICGAESGPSRRPFELNWATDLWVQCLTMDIPFFGKQDSGLRPGVPLLIDGQEIKQWPQ